MPASARPLVPNASAGGMANRTREPVLTPVSAVMRPGMVSVPWRMKDAVDLVSKSLWSCFPSLPRNSAWRTVTLSPPTLASPVPSLRVFSAVALTLTGGDAIVTFGVTAGSSPATVIPSSTLRSSGLFSGEWAGSVAAAVAAPVAAVVAEPDAELSDEQAARAGTSTREVRAAAMAAREERTREGPSEGDRGPATVTAPPVAQSHRPQGAHSLLTCCRSASSPGSPRTRTGPCRGRCAAPGRSA